MTVPATGNLIDVYRPSAAFALVTPDKPHQITYRPEKNGPGSGSFSIPMDDPAYGDIAVNDFVAIRPDGNTVEVLLVEEIDEHTLDVQGGARQVATYMGRLVGGQLEWAVVAPALGAGAQPVEEDALFDWPSPRYSPAAYSDTWVGATQIMSVTAAKGGGWPTQPMGQDFTDSLGAYMCWDSSGDDTFAPEGPILGYLDFTVTEGGRYALEFLMDNYGEVRIDGVPQLEINQTEGYHRASFKPVELSTDKTHRLAWFVRNIDGPGAYAYNLYKADHQSHPLPGGELVAVSSSADQIMGYPASFPGMTVGDILTQLVEEARDGTVEAERDVWPWLVCNFDLADDSNGDPWERLSITTKTQTTNLLQFLDELVAAGRISRWGIQPDGVTLDVFRPGYATRPTFSAPYTAGYALSPAPVNDPRSGQLVQLDRRIT